MYKKEGLPEVSELGFRLSSKSPTFQNCLHPSNGARGFAAGGGSDSGFGCGRGSRKPGGKSAASERAFLASRPSLSEPCLCQASPSPSSSESLPLLLKSITAFRCSGTTDISRILGGSADSMISFLTTGSIAKGRREGRPGVGEKG